MATKVVEELNLEEKVTVKNIANWTVGFRRKTEMEGDISIAPNGQVRLSRNEIIANKLFSGTDGRGSHATLLIDDEATRKELDFDSEDGKSKQLVFSDELVKNVFAIKSQSAFEKTFRETFFTRAEKYAVIQAIKRLKINDYSRIRFAEKYTEYSVD